MGYFYHLLFEYPFLSLIQVGITIWMLVDARNRGVDYFWYWIILIFQPIGPWAYFFVYQVYRIQGLRGLTLFQRRASLEELRYNVQQKSTLASHLELAERLVERGEFTEAIPHLETAQAREPDHGQVLYLLAECFFHVGQPGKALPLLEQILARDRRWSDYKAWRLLVTEKDRNGDKAGALASCRDLARLSPTLEHRCMLAELLLERGHKEEARTLLDHALQDHHFAPGPSRRRNRAWAKQARQLQRRAHSA
jgi:hypothetical protein